MNAISLQNTLFYYEENRPTLYIKEFSVKSGERIFLHGPSGSGKTTLLGLVTGVLVAQQGTVQVLREDLGKISNHRRDMFRADRMGYIFQQFNLIPYLSVVENILLPLWMSKNRLARINSSPEQEAEYLAAQLGLKSYLNKNVLQLSVGQQQRVAVARALIGNPELIVADEPTSALDENLQQEFIDLFLSRTKDKQTTVIFVSHNKHLARHFDRSISLAELNIPNLSSQL